MSNNHHITWNNKAQAIVNFTRIGMLLPYVDFLTKLGLPVERHLSSARLSPDLLQTPDALIPLNLAYGFVHKACHDEGIEDIGFRVGRSTGLQQLGKYGQLLMSARNVNQYLDFGCRYIGMVTSSDHYWRVNEGEQVRFCFCSSGIDESDKVIAHVYPLIITINTLREIVGRDWCPEEITLPALSQDLLSELLAYFPDSRIKTGQDSVASFLLPRTFLALRMPQGHGSAGDPSQPTFTTAMPTEFLASVRQLTKSLLVNGCADVHSAAEISGLSARTFQRRLAECGLSYSALVAEMRVELAEAWLRDADRPITEIAFALGYKDASNFTRNFRRINGVSPKAYRDAFVAA